MSLALLQKKIHNIDSVLELFFFFHFKLCCKTYLLNQGSADVTRCVCVKCHHRYRHLGVNEILATVTEDEGDDSKKLGLQGLYLSFFLSFLFCFVLFLFVCFLGFFFLLFRPHLQHIEVPRLEVQLELQLPA